MKYIYDYTYEQLEEMIIEHGWKKFHSDQIFRWLYRQRVNSFEEMTNLKKEIKETLASEFSFYLPEIINRQVSRDGTRKYLFKMQDGSSVETVLMNYDYGKSLCVSSQVGCNMGCSFCASGLLKKQRDLTSGEIVSQVLMVQKELDLEGTRVSHVVVMGTGEPFDNYDNVLDFCHTINNDVGLGIGARHITISTCGLADKIRRFADEHTQYNLAISLHAPNDELRSKIMKVNKAFPLDELFDALRYYVKENNRRLAFEYILIGDLNDDDKCAKELANLTKGFDVFVNLIPYNPVIENGYKSVDYKQAMLFYDKLKKLGVSCTLRQEHGRDIDAACGQLRAKHERSKKD